MQPAHLLGERLEQIVLGAQSFAPVRMRQQLKGGISDEVGHRNRRAQQIEQLDRRDTAVQRFAVQVPVMRHDHECPGRIALQLTGTHLLDQVLRPGLGLATSLARRQVPGSDAARAVDHLRQLVTAQLTLGGWQRHSSPAADTVGEQHLHFTEQLDFALCLPLADRLTPAPLGQADQLVDSRGVQQLQEHAFAMAMRLAIEPLDAPLSEQRLLQHPRHRLRALKVALVIEQARRLFPAQADGVLHQQTRLKNIAVQALAAIADEGITFAQQRQRTLQMIIARNVSHAVLQ